MGVQLQAKHRISVVARTGFLVFRVDPALRRDIQRIADEEQRTLTQVCEMLLNEGVEAYKQEGRERVHSALGRQTEGQNQRLMIWKKRRCPCC
jgi:hypothetical protein